MPQQTLAYLERLARRVRSLIIASTSTAGSGHLTSSLSAVELMVSLLFGGIFRADLKNPDNPNNDRLIFSKGHAAPLLYSLYATAGVLKEKELETLRQFGSPLEGHPTPRFRFVEAATGSLGQGLSIGLGMALNAKYLDKLPSRTFILLGDGEMAEGQNWEAIELASHYKLGNLVGIIDVNRLGQSSPTMLGHKIEAYAQRVAAFGWKTLTANGHQIPQILAAYWEATEGRDSPSMIIAKTLKGKGVPFMEDREGYHGKVLSKDELETTLKRLTEPEPSVRGFVTKPSQSDKAKTQRPTLRRRKKLPGPYKPGTEVATREAFGTGLVKAASQYPNIVVLDADVKNSTFSQTFEEYYPDRFFEMYIAEQNMVSVALGLSLRGKIPFVSTFAAFLTRAFDQIRMASYSNANLKFVGTHVGVSIGQDGPSQMGLEDIAMFRTIHGSTVLYPSDAVSCEKLVTASAAQPGIVYLRLTRKETPVMYAEQEQFSIGGSKTLKQSQNDEITLCGAGVTLQEALTGGRRLAEEGIVARVIDLYSIKPIDRETLAQAAKETKAIVVIEDHHPEGGIAEAVRSALYTIPTPVYSLAVRRREMSGKPDELLDYEDISATDIARLAKVILGAVIAP